MNQQPGATQTEQDLQQVSDETDLQDFLKRKFEQRGWDAFQEVRPDGSSYRADLILRHDVFGRIGVETKYIRSGSSAKAVAQAHDQITERYWDAEYGGEPILLWAVCIYPEQLHGPVPDAEADKQDMGFWVGRVRELFCHWGIGYIGLDRYATIDYGYSLAERKIPGFPVRDHIPVDVYDEVNINAIRDTVRKKRGAQR